MWPAYDGLSQLDLQFQLLLVCQLFNHILRTVPSYTISSQLARFDEHLRLTLSSITHSPISDRAWQQASLPFRLGSLSLKQALPSAHAAFLASCYSSHDLVCQLLSSSSNLNSTPLGLPGESDAFDALQVSFDLEFPLPTMSQSALQAPSDEATSSDLISQSSIRDQA